MKKYIFFLLFIFTGLWSRGQKSADIPALIAKLSQSKADTARISLLITLGNYHIFYGFRNNLDSARLFYNQALQLSIELHETDLQYKALEKLAFCASYDRDFALAQQIYRRVIAYYHQTGQVAKEAKMWVELAERYGHYYESEYMDTTIGYFERGRSLYLQNNQPVEAAGALACIANRRIYFRQFDLAENELLQVLAQYKAAGYERLQGVYQYFYSFHFTKGNYYRAMAYVMEAINRMSIEGDTINSMVYYQRAAECNMAVKKYEKAIEWLYKAMTVYNSHTPYKYLLAQSLIALNRITEAQPILLDLSKKEPASKSFQLKWTLALYHHKLRNYDQAIRYYIKAISVTDSTYHMEHADKTKYLMCNNGLADVYLQLHEFSNAKQCLDKAASIFTTAKISLDPALLADYYGHLYHYQVATGHHAAAVKSLERRVKLQDSLFTADKDKQLAELNIQYETAQKEQSIKNLQSESTAQQAATEKATLQRNITIAGILVLLVVSLLFYRNYQQKKAANNTISYKNMQLQHLLTEKEWLLKEVHHRVKNNLQTIISLLQSQAIYLQDDALKANQVSKNRIYAMSLIHQQLYKTEDVKSIDMALFLTELLDHLSDSFGTERRIVFHRSISPIKLEISQAIPIALIVNEGVTNAIKYAFPDEQPGTIRISMHQPADTISLVIADDGVGIDPAIIDQATNSLGMQLLKGLTEDIDGEIAITNDNGTTISIRFKPDPLNEFIALSSPR